MREYTGPYLIWTRHVLRLYPPDWRARYAAEMEIVLQHHRVTLWTLLDVLLGALDAHLHPDLLPGRLMSMAHRIRSSEIAIFCAFVLFFVAWLPINQVRDPLSEWEGIVRVHPELSVAMSLLNLATLVAVLAILAGGLPILASALRQAIAARRWQVPLLLLVAVLALAAFAAYALLTIEPSTTTQSSAPNAPLTPLAFALQLGLVVIFFAAAAGSTVAGAAAIARSEPSVRVLRLALVSAAVATLAIGVGLAATLALDGLIVAEAPELFSPGTMPFIVIVALMMLAALVLAVAALRRGLSASRGATGAA